MAFVARFRLHSYILHSLIMFLQKWRAICYLGCVLGLLSFFDLYELNTKWHWRNLCENFLKCQLTQSAVLLNSAWLDRFPVCCRFSDLTHWHRLHLLALFRNWLSELLPVQRYKFYHTNSTCRLASWNTFVCNALHKSALFLTFISIECDSRIWNHILFFAVTTTRRIFIFSISNSNFSAYQAYLRMEYTKNSYCCGPVSVVRKSAEARFDKC